MAVKELSYWLKADNWQSTLSLLSVWLRWQTLFDVVNVRGAFNSLLTQTSSSNCHICFVYLHFVWVRWRVYWGQGVTGGNTTHRNLHLLICPLSTLLCLCIFYYDWYFLCCFPAFAFYLEWVFFLFRFFFGLWSFIFIDSWLKAHVVDLFSIFYEPLTVPTFRIWHNF